MKSPWNIFSRLRSRRAAHDERERLAPDTRPRENEIEKPAPRDISSVKLEDLASTREDEIDKSVSEPIEEVPAAREAVTPPETLIEPESSADQPQPAQFAKRGSASPRNHASAKSPSPNKGIAGLTAKEKNKRQIAKKATAPAKTPHEAVRDDLTGLDEEIRQLRRELSRKIRLQNTQIRKMLERFERD